MTVDLTNCDREPIHVPGQVQPHGFLIVIDKNLDIRFHSENISDFLPQAGANILGMPIRTIEALIGQNEPPDFINQLISFGRANGFEQTNPFAADINGKPFFLVINPSDDLYLLEFESAVSYSNIDVQKVVGRSISIMLAEKKLPDLLSTTAKRIKEIIDYDRVMVYRFADDGHGEVAAESKNHDLESWLGLHYPASDIPKQARELYKKNLTRIIANVDATPAKIIGERANTELKLDLTASQLRAVSPIHIQYLKNMKVASSFSISLIYNGELWGLVACHNYTPHFIDYKSRESAKLIGQILSSALEFRQDEENQQYKQKFKTVVDSLSRYMLRSSSIELSLTGEEITLLDSTMATGAVLITENETVKLGVTPGDDQIAGIVQWISENVNETLFYTEELPVVYPGAASFAGIACGLMVSVLSRELGEYALWFKPERLQTIKWAGNPDKPVEESTDGRMHISPRKSFEVWSQTVAGKSEKWSPEEVKAVIRLRGEIISAVNQKATQIRVLNEKLKEAYEELDTFSYTVSHDLKNPLTAIKSYAQILLKNKDLTPDMSRILERILAGTDNMNVMVKEVLEYSKIGRADVEMHPVDPEPMIRELIKDLKVVYSTDNLEVTLGSMPLIHGDPLMLSQIFANILSNAVKYSLRSDPPQIKVKGIVNEDEVIYSISDNGVGIDIQQLPKVFDLFKRMDNVQDVEGSGVGLAIVKRIINKHKGKIWADSELGKGTTFYLAFRQPLASS